MIPILCYLMLDTDFAVPGESTRSASHFLKGQIVDSETLVNWWSGGSRECWFSEMPSWNQPLVWLINATRKPTHAPSGHVRRKVQKPSQRNWTILFFPAETPCLPRPSLAGISWAIFFLSMFVGFWACIKRPLWNHDMMLANDFQTQLWLWFACSCW